jgi:drug/metabolite transporter (DMT)-like permease
VANLKTQVALAFAAVYLIWGSTYLAIRFVIESLPPFFMAGTRFMIAGAILYLLTRLRGAQTPSRDQWGKAALVGGLMLLGGNGAVVWAEQYLPSGSHPSSLPQSPYG